MCVLDLRLFKTGLAFSVQVTGLEWVEPEMAVLQSSEDKTLRLWDLRSCSVVQHFRARQYVQVL